MNSKQAKILYEMFDVGTTLDDPEEVGLLKDNNPAFLGAMFALQELAFAQRDKGGCDVFSTKRF